MRTAIRSLKESADVKGVTEKHYASLVKMVQSPVWFLLETRGLTLCGRLTIVSTKWREWGDISCFCTRRTQLWWWTK